MQTKRRPKKPKHTTRFMRGTTPDGQSITWLPMAPYLMGDPKLVALVKVVLFMESLNGGGILVTPTGPLVDADVKEKLAVFAAANLLTRDEIEWENPPDVLFGEDPDSVF